MTALKRKRLGKFGYCQKKLPAIIHGQKVFYYKNKSEFCGSKKQPLKMENDSIIAL